MTLLLLFTLPFLLLILFTFGLRMVVVGKQKWLLFLTLVSIHIPLLTLAGDTNHSRSLDHGVKVASFKFEYVKTELILALFIVLIGIFKLGKSGCC